MCILSVGGGLTLSPFQLGAAAVLLTLLRFQHTVKLLIFAGDLNWLVFQKCKYCLKTNLTNSGHYVSSLSDL